jgi:hypothetical protein
MIEQQAGYITLPDGVAARRCVHLERHETHRPDRIAAATLPIVSDSLGFPEQCLDGFEADRQASGHSDISFVRDPQVPEFFQVHAGSQRAMDAYTKHRKLVNRTGSLGGGVRLSQDELDRAAELVSRCVKQSGFRGCVI